MHNGHRRRRLLQLRFNHLHKESLLHLHHLYHHRHPWPLQIWAPNLSGCFQKRKRQKIRLLRWIIYSLEISLKCDSFESERPLIMPNWEMITKSRETFIFYFIILYYNGIFITKHIAWLHCSINCYLINSFQVSGYKLRLIRSMGGKLKKIWHIMVGQTYHFHSSFLQWAITI